MARATLSAAVLLAAVAGLTGCGSDARYLMKDDHGVAIVTVPQSDLFQWYYRHEAMEFIRDNNPNFKDSDIISQGPVYVGQRIDQPKLGPDGKPLANPPGMSTEKEYQIVFRRNSPINKAVVGPVPTTPGLPNNGMPMNTVTPVSGVQNVNPQYSGMNAPTQQYGGVQNVNAPPYPMQQPTGPLMTPAPNYQPSMPSSSPGLYNR